MSDQKMELSQIDNETLVEHYVLAAIDQRLDDHEYLGQECIEGWPRTVLQTA